VTSQKIFPSRLSLGGEAGDDKGTGFKHLVNIFRRLHRIFAHAWFQHRDVFWGVEGETGLYVLFKTVCDTYELLPAENYKLPPEAEGLEASVEPEVSIPSIMRSDSTKRGGSRDLNGDPNFINAGHNTRRHIRSSPSTGSAVTTVLEADEVEEVHEEAADSDTDNMAPSILIAPPAAESESTSSHVPIAHEGEPQGSDNVAVEITEVDDPATSDANRFDDDEDPITEHDEIMEELPIPRHSFEPTEPEETETEETHETTSEFIAETKVTNDVEGTEDHVQDTAENSEPSSMRYAEPDTKAEVDKESESGAS
jgi:hypothetical protein